MAITALVFALATSHLRFTTKITSFLPDDSQNRAAQIATILAESEISKVMVIDLSGKPEALHDAAESLLTFLHAEPDVATARSGVTEEDTTQTLAFLGSWPATTFLPTTAYSDAQIHERLGSLIEQLGSPMGTMIAASAPRDPLGGAWAPLGVLRAAGTASIVDEDGILMSSDHAHAFVFVETKSSTFDSTAQRAFRARLDAWLRTTSVTMQTAGGAQYAIASEAQMKGDINRIGIISTIGILAIFLVLFGSIRMIAIGIVPMAFGSAIAILGTQAIFGEIHGITIAFGTSLLGVGLDYVEHYYAHFVLSPDVPADTTMRVVGPSIALGAATTIIGFIGLAAAGVAGLRQMAVFSMIAIVASLVATYWMIPCWMPVTYRAPRTLGWVNRGVLALLVRITRRAWSRTAKVALVVVTIAGGLLAAHHAQFTDNVNMLIDDHGPHVTDDKAVRSRLAPESDAVAVVTADTDEALLVGIGKASKELAGARDVKLITSFVALDGLLPTREEQLARFAAAKAAEPRIRAAMTELGIVPDEFAPFWATLAAPAPKLLTLADVRKSPLAPVLTAWVPAYATPVALIPLVGVTNLAALRARVTSATIIVPATTIQEVFGNVRERTLGASGLGLIIIFLLLAVRYRSARKAMVALAPALLACAATVGFLIAIGDALNILHVMSLLLVVSLGVDFGIFFVDTNSTLEEAARTMVSIITASITTILSFGLLGVSQSPGLAAIGVTVTAGVTFSLVFCFLMASLAGPNLVPKERT
ncbi:MAG TPA: MMPL family transporter [Kofleriaceae bacterium]